MDSKFDKFDTEGAVRPTILKPSDEWEKTYFEGLLGTKEQITLTKSNDKLQEHKNKAFDLLDALTKSGAISLEDVDLHIVVAATHSFDKTVMETLIQQNTNPIEKIQHSSLIMTSTIHGVPFPSIIQESQREELEKFSPNLLL